METQIEPVQFHQVISKCTVRMRNPGQQVWLLYLEKGKLKTQPHVNSESHYLKLSFNVCL